MRLKVSNVCQLYDKTYLVTQTVNGVTFTNNGDGSVTVNGTASNIATAEGEFLHANPGDKILMFSGYDTAALKTAFVYCSQWDENKHWIADLGYPSLLGRISTCNKNCRYIRYTYRVDRGNTATNAVIKLQIFNLTEMYGAGHEPTTVAQFRQDFPNEMYEYSPVCWKKFRRLKYIANKEPVQLLDKSKYHGSSTFEGVTFTNNGDGTWTVVGTAPDVPANKEYVRAPVIIWDLEFSKKHFIPGHKIVVAGGVSMDSAGKSAVVQWIWGWTGGYDAANSWKRTVHTIRQYPEDKLLEYSNYIELRVYAGATVNFTFKPQFFDLTEMYGAGNEPTTVEQFRADFPNELYDYNLYNYLTLNRGKYIANKEPVQLLDKSKYPATQTMHGVTFTNNGDGTITVNGTNNGEIYYSLEVLTSIPVGHKVIIDDGNSTLYFFGGMWTKDNVVIGTIRPRTIFTLPSNLARLNMLYFVRYNTGGVTYNNELSRPQLFDLTAMYGAGNEPTTVAQFRADFPNELYDYNPYNAITFR